LQDKVTESVIGAIEPTLKKAEIEPARRKPNANLDAYDLYLRALPMVQAFQPDANLEGLGLLNQAIALDPGFAPALAHAAWCYEQRITRGWTAVGEDDNETAVTLATRALATGTDDATALVVAGFVVSLVGRDWSTGLDAARRALNCNSGSGFVSLMANLTATFAGEPDEGLCRLSERWR
jgi:hypothetical protein